MNEPSTITPPPRRRGWNGWSLPLRIALAVAGGAAAVRLAVYWQLPTPVCWMRQLTGVPCPGCGCTRSVLAWTRFDLLEALRFNPLFFGLCLSLLVWLGLRGVERITGRSWMEAWRERARSWPVWRILAVLAALNWIYLIVTLPK